VGVGGPAGPQDMVWYLYWHTICCVKKKNKKLSTVIFMQHTICGRVWPAGPQDVVSSKIKSYPQKKNKINVALVMG